MIDRIGTLNLHYRVGGGTLAPALTAGLDRALQAGLGQALGPRLAALIGDDKAVTVVRELNAPLALAMSGSTLDSQVVDSFARACTTALADLLSRDPDRDTVMRFDDETAFAGSFVVALLEGTAWDRWYYGAFQRYRRADTASTLRALLEDPSIDTSRLFGWLARHGHLAALLGWLPPAEALLLLGAGAQTDASDGSPALIDCARSLLAILAPGDEAQFAQRIAAFLGKRPVKPDWSSRASLSAWVVQLLRFVLQVQDGDTMPALGPQQREALHALLTGPLDWLDAAWLEAQLCATQAVPVPARPQHPDSSRQLLTPRQRRILQLLAQDLRSSGLALPDDAGMDDTIVHLIAMAAQHAGGEHPLDRSLIAVIELAAQAAQDARSPAPAPAHRGDGPGMPGVVRAQAPADRSGAVDALRAAGAPALDLLDALRTRAHRLARAGEASAMAGVFLLARAIQDMRLLALAEDAGLPSAPLLTGLATLWTGQDLSADGALPLWRPDRAQAGEPAGDALEALNAALLEQLIERRVLAPDDARRAVDADTAALGRMPRIDSRLRVTACLLLRAWAYWLPGLGGSGPLFLLNQCIRRDGAVGVHGRCIEVELAPAPLDVVLKMAGYLEPLGPTGWLGGRSLVFHLRDRLRAPPP